MTDYTLDSTAGAWSQQEIFPRHLFSHLGFPECSCCLECKMYARLCHDYGLMVISFLILLGSQVVRAFALCLEGPGSIPGRVKPKILNW